MYLSEKDIYIYIYIGQDSRDLIPYLSPFIVNTSRMLIPHLPLCLHIFRLMVIVTMSRTQENQI
jgi:hypothetical protein